MFASVPAVSQAGAGDPDLEFGTGGKAIFNFSDIATNWISGPYSAVVQPDGKIVVAGNTSGNSGSSSQTRNVIIRLNADGSPDASFGDSGQIELPFSTASTAVGLALQADGRIVVALTTMTISSDQDFAVARLNSDGTMDGSYATNGKLIIDVEDGSRDRLGAIALLDDGGVIIAGKSLSLDTYRYQGVLARLTPDGAIDHSFGTAGLVALDLEDEPLIGGIELQADGKILLSGAYFPVGRTCGVDLARFSADGALDDSFGDAGFVCNARASGHGAVKTQPDGKIVALDRDWGDRIFRYLPDGQIDSAFGDQYNGIVGDSTLDALGIYDIQMSDIEIQSDGRIVVGGTFYFFNDEFRFRSSRFAAVRLDSHGMLDATFGVSGVVTAEFQVDPLTNDPVESVGRDLTLLADDYLLLTGYVDYALAPSNVFNTRIGLLKLDPLGNTMAGFGEDGQVLANVERETDEKGGSVTTVQGDGKIVTAASILTVHGWDFLVTRHEPDGRLDTSFGGTGWTTTDIRSERRVVDGPYYTSIETQLSDDRPVAVTVQPDGKIIVGGTSRQDVGNYPLRSDSRFVLVRYNADGSLDPSFGNGGILLQERIGTVGRGDTMGDMALQGDGKIVITGRTWIDQMPPAPGYEFVTIRYLADGSIDPGFGQNGLVITNGADSRRNDYPQAIVIQPNDKILVGGWFEGYLGRPFRSVVLIRYLEDGSLDAGFGTNGRVWESTQDDPEVGYNFPDWGLKSIGLQSDGKIVIGSEMCAFYWSGSKTGCRLALARYGAAGTRDTTFGSQGLYIFGLYQNSQEVLESIAIQSDDRIVVLGEALYFTRSIGNGRTWGRPPASKYFRNQDVVAARFMPDGRPDYTFGDRGVALTDFANSDDLGQAVTIQSDGKILAAGSAAFLNGVYEDPDWDLALARYEGINTRVDELEGLVSELQSLARRGLLNDGQAKSLGKQLEAAIFQIDRGNVTTARSQLEAFLKSLDSFVRTGVLAQADADYFGNVVATVIATWL